MFFEGREVDPKTGPGQRQQERVGGAAVRGMRRV